MPTFQSSSSSKQIFASIGNPILISMQNSNSFFQAEHSLIRVTQTLDATCKADFASCSTLMGSLAQQIRDDSNCGQDYTAQNPLVEQAYNGLMSYAPMYQAGCLKDGSGNYCFANAITNTSSPTDSYVYYLPLGVQLPGGSRPTCSGCLQQTMTLFNEAASNLSQPVSVDYTVAAQQINIGCGPNFVNTTIAPIKGSAHSGAEAVFSIPKLGCLVAILVMAFSQLI